ncbi:hypothetical protein H1Q63_26460 [Desmonostoc muscorum CCALA 125]|nr:hypothetical protein [Desmonostoc muscorum CCALA 125]
MAGHLIAQSQIMPLRRDWLQNLQLNMGKILLVEKAAIDEKYTANSESPLKTSRPCWCYVS